MRFVGRVSGACWLPGRVAVLAHVNGAGDIAALNDSLEGPGDIISWNLHVAAELDLVGVNQALEFRVVDFAILHSREIISALFESELLLTDAAGILDGDGPRSLDRSGSAGRNDRIIIVTRFGETLVDSISDDAVLAWVHHVRHDGDRALHHGRPAAHASVDNDARRACVKPRNQLRAGDFEYVGIPVDAQTRRLVGEVLRFQVFEAGGGKRLQPGLNVLEPGPPLALLGFVIAFVPLLNGC